jgi:hypothetical protein
MDSYFGKTPAPPQGPLDTLPAERGNTQLTGQILHMNIFVAHFLTIKIGDSGNHYVLMYENGKIETC